MGAEGLCLEGKDVFALIPVDDLKSIILFQLCYPFFLQTPSHCNVLGSFLKDANCHFVILLPEVLCHWRVLFVFQ